MTGLGLTLTLVRHGESIGNVAAAQAHASSSEVVDVPARDGRRVLSERGIAQARALGCVLGGRGRASGGGLFVVLALPSGSTDRTDLPGRCRGDRARSDRRTVARSRPGGPGHLDGCRDPAPLSRGGGQGVGGGGKLNHRPSGGESWADVIGRVRSVMRDISDLESGQHVLVVSHDVVIMSFGYVAELLTEDEVLSIAGDSPLLNASVTHLARDADGRWHVERYNDATHVERSEATVTQHPGERHEQPR